LDELSGTDSAYDLLAFGRPTRCGSVTSRGILIGLTACELSLDWSSQFAITDVQQCKALGSYDGDFARQSVGSRCSGRIGEDVQDTVWQAIVESLYWCGLHVSEALARRLTFPPSRSARVWTCTVEGEEVTTTSLVSSDASLFHQMTLQRRLTLSKLADQVSLPSPQAPTRVKSLLASSLAAHGLY
jgi:hypothetical protein